jgi:hypothetical protein
LDNLFRKELLTKDWETLPPLGPKQHFYAPNVKYVSASPSIPLNFHSIRLQLREEYRKFHSLLESRRDCWEREQDWNESISSISSSSSDSDQEFEVEEILDKKIDDDDIVWYKVSWKYYPGESTWIKKSNMANALDLIQEYENNN